MKNHRQRRQRPAQRVYFIQCGEGGPIKIGRAANPAQRLEELQTGNPTALRLLGVTPLLPNARMTELDLHAYFWRSRVRLEWFAASERLLGAIEDYCHEDSPLWLDHETRPVP